MTMCLVRAIAAKNSAATHPAHRDVEARSVSQENSQATLNGSAPSLI